MAQAPSLQPQEQDTYKIVNVIRWLLNQVTGATGVQSANTVYAGPTTGAAATPTFRTLVGAESAVKLITSATAANSATIDFTTGITSTYETFMFSLIDVLTVTSNVSLGVRFSEDSGVTYKASGYRWGANVVSDAGTNTPIGNTSDTEIQLSGANLGNANPFTTAGLVLVYHPTQSTANKYVDSLLVQQAAGGTMRRQDSGGTYTTDTGAVNGVRFILSAGNITSGTIRMYGILPA